MWRGSTGSFSLPRQHQFLFLLLLRLSPFLYFLSKNFSWFFYMRLCFGPQYFSLFLRIFGLIIILTCGLSRTSASLTLTKTAFSEEKFLHLVSISFRI